MNQNIIYYLQIGFTHVIPLGFDHILFILSLTLLSSKLKSVIVQCSVFTIAHSITLILAASSLILPNVKVIEPLIAISIFYMAIENIFNPKVNKWRIIIIFCFGLIHGMGFANALISVGIPKDNFILSLLLFNLGVELGQISIIIIAYLLIYKLFGDKTWYKDRIVYPISAIIAGIALFWTIQRIFFSN